MFPTISMETIYQWSVGLDKMLLTSIESDSTDLRAFYTSDDQLDMIEYEDGAALLLGSVLSSKDSYYYSFSKTGNLEAVDIDYLSQGVISASVKYFWEPGSCHRFFDFSLSRHFDPAENLQNGSEIFPFGVFNERALCNKKSD